MAGQLIDQMTVAWKPEHLKHVFTTAIDALVAAKAKARKTATVKAFERAPDMGGSNVVVLTERLRQSPGDKPGKAKSLRTPPAARS
jgi:non-homologous end joining protein Ku